MTTFELKATRYYDGTDEQLSSMKNVRRYVENCVHYENIHYEIDIETLDELMQFIKDNGGRVVIEIEVDADYIAAQEIPLLPTIEIYNDWRE